MGDFKKIVALLIIISLTGGMFLLYIQQAKAGAFMYFLKEFIIKPLVRKLANALENKLVNSINGLVSGLIQKTPSFIQNWRNYTLDSQARGNDIFRSVLADARLCPYFKTNLQTAFGADKYIGFLSSANINKTSISGLPSFRDLTNCTLPANLNIDTFKTDFVKGGGWDTWNKLIQPQNNFFGVYSLALGEQAMQMQTEKESARDYSIAGQGFLGQKLGNGGAIPNGCTGSTLAGGAGRCIWFGKEVTPPKFLGDLSEKSLETKIGRVGYGQELTDVVFDLITAVINTLSNKILNFTGQSDYSAPPGGNTNFNEAGATETSPPEYSDPAIICRNACESDYNQCVSKAETEVCKPNPEPPPEETCQLEPDQVEIDKCDAARDSCISSCPQ